MNDMKNIILIGMMGCGKTTVGTLLAERTGRTLADTDALIEAREGRTINEIFSAQGESYFRELELGVSLELSHPNNLVIACGGGLPLRPDCIAPLKSGGIVFWLCRDPGETYDSMDRMVRPLARQGKQDFLDRFAQRAPIYRRWADHIIHDFSSPAATMNNILEVLK